MSRISPLVLFLTSVLTALIISMIPFGGLWSYALPDWVALIVLWWNLREPRLISVGIAWFCGLVMDVSYGSLLGSHALSLVVVSYLAIRLHRPYSLFSIIQQTILIVLLLALYRILLFWIFGATGDAPDNSEFWWPILSSLIIWPWMSLLLARLLSSPETEPSED